MAIEIKLRSSRPSTRISGGHKRLWNPTVPRSHPGRLVLPDQEIILWQSPDQEQGDSVESNQLIADLRKRKEPVLGDVVAEVLIKNRHLIPSDWRGKRVHFATVYEMGLGARYNWYISTTGSGVEWGCNRHLFAASDFGPNDYIAMRPKR